MMNFGKRSKERKRLLEKEYNALLDRIWEENYQKTVEAYPAMKPQIDEALEKMSDEQLRAAKKLAQMASVGTAYHWNIHDMDFVSKVIETYSHDMWLAVQRIVFTAMP